MRYPVKGGYKSFISSLAKNSNIMFDHEVLKIDPINKIVFFTNKTEIQYTNLLSSMPLPLLIQKIINVPKEMKLLSEKLYTTSIALVSIGFNKVIDFPSIWFYVYDQDIPFARAYSPSLKSSENAPKGMSSLQCEIYFSKVSPLKLSRDELSKKAIDSLIRMGLISSSDVIFTDVKYINYANVVFYSGMEEDRDKLITFISQYNIKSIGRFGEWDYLWSNQSFMSGYKAAKTI